MKPVEIKRDFGSFHSSNVEELIHQSDIDYKPVELSVLFDTKKYSDLNLPLKFGTPELKQTLFYLDKKFCFLNHGAFGLSFKPVVEYVNEWKMYAESQPLRFYDRQIMPLLVDLIRRYSTEIFKCKPNELVLVENCTFAFNSIINSARLNKDDKVYIYSTTYGVYKKILRTLCQTTGSSLIEEVIEFPIIDENDLEEKTLGKLKQALEHDSVNKRIKYIFIDHIPSNQPFLMPIQKISEYCKGLRPDIIFVVDAAHSLGSVKDFGMKGLKSVDVLFTNCHKWFSGPKGTAFMYKKENINLNLRPVVHSHGIHAGFNSEFIWTGLRDYSAYLGLYANLELWTKCLGGLDTSIEYCTSLAREAGNYLKKSWSTSFLVEPGLCTTMMCVRLPDEFVSNVVLVNEISYDQAELVQNYLYFQYSIEVPIKCIQNQLYVRISAHLYNNMDDYKKLANAVLENF